MTLPIPQLQQAVLAHLRSDTSVSALANNVYDRVPNKAAMPYVSMGDMLCRDQSTIAKQQFLCELSLNTTSRTRDDADADALVAALHSSLENAALSVSGYTLISSRFINARSSRSVDGQRVQGEALFEFIVEAG